ncbi:MAG: acyltransferase family protein [Firmicutes bacterium]|nr:acyltransferase family protein [Bacillota bacterium]
MTERNYAIQYTRGIAMLGVIGIHVGAYSLGFPNASIHLFALLDIFTRFSVPIFFFLSAFGLFLNHDLTGQFSYTDFLKRRFRAVLLPYTIWSIIYLVNYALSTRTFWSLQTLIETFFFGLASYHLYFLVILLWFYILMPLWRIMLRQIVKSPLPHLVFLLILQIAFNYYSSYALHFQSDNYIVNLFIRYRLNYLVLHYLFIFILGAVAALRFADFTAFIKKQRLTITTGFFASLGALLANYYWLLANGLSATEAAGIVHQLNPLGVIYTLAASLFFFALLDGASGLTAATLDIFGRYSYPVYLVHPLVLEYLARLIIKTNFPLTPPLVIAIFLAVILFSLSIAAIIKNISQRFYLIGLLLTGSKKPRSTVKPTNIPHQVNA